MASKPAKRSTAAPTAPRPLDVIVARKLGFPDQEPELALGAIGEDGRRVDLFRGDRPRVSLAGRTAPVVDDGVATGSTARAACQVIRVQGAGGPGGPGSSQSRPSAEECHWIPYHQEGTRHAARPAGHPGQERRRDKSPSTTECGECSRSTRPATSITRLRAERRDGKKTEKDYLLHKLHYGTLLREGVAGSDITPTCKSHVGRPVTRPSDVMSTNPVTIGPQATLADPARCPLPPGPVARRSGPPSRIGRGLSARPGLARHHLRARARTRTGQPARRQAASHYQRHQH
jgi:hypothetical protein